MYRERHVWKHHRHTTRGISVPTSDMGEFLRGNVYRAKMLSRYSLAINVSLAAPVSQGRRPIHCVCMWQEEVQRCTIGSMFSNIIIHVQTEVRGKSAPFRSAVRSRFVRYPIPTPGYQSGARDHSPNQLEESNLVVECPGYGPDNSTE